MLRLAKEEAERKEKEIQDGLAKIAEEEKAANDKREQEKKQKEDDEKKLDMQKRMIEQYKRRTEYTKTAASNHVMRLNY